MESQVKYIDLLDNQFNEHFEEARIIGRLGGDYITEEGVCLLIYVRCQSIVPKDSSEIEIFDPSGYRFQIEKMGKLFAEIKNCATFIYLECPRSNPLNLPQSKKIIQQIDQTQAQGLLLIQYCFAQGQSWDSINDQSRKESFKSFIENLQNFQLGDFMEHISNMPHNSIIGNKKLDLIFNTAFSPIDLPSEIKQIRETDQLEVQVKEISQQEENHKNLIQQLQDKIKSLEDRLTDSESYNQKLEDELELVKKDKESEILVLQDRIKDIQEELVSANLNSLNTEKARSIDEQSSIIQADTESTSYKLSQKCDKYKQKVKDKKLKIKELKQENKEHHDTIIALKEQILEFSQHMQYRTSEKTHHQDDSYYSHSSSKSQKNEQQRNEAKDQIKFQSQDYKAFQNSSFDQSNYDQKQQIQENSYEESKQAYFNVIEREDQFNLFDRLQQEQKVVKTHTNIIDDQVNHYGASNDSKYFDLQSNNSQGKSQNNVQKIYISEKREDISSQDYNEIMKEIQFQEWKQKKLQEEQDNKIALQLREEEQKQIEQKQILIAQQTLRDQECQQFQQRIFKAPQFEDHLQQQDQIQNLNLIDQNSSQNKEQQISTPTMMSNTTGFEDSLIIKEDDINLIRDQVGASATFRKVYDNEEDQQFDKLQMELEGKKGLIFLTRAKNAKGDVVGSFGAYISIPYQAQKEQSFKDSKAFIFSLDKKIVFPQIDPTDSNISLGPSKIIQMGKIIEGLDKHAVQQLDLVLRQNGQTSKSSSNIGQSFKLPQGENQKVLTNILMFFIDRLEVYQMVTY
ncbi:UNKNOWN [Stylonychia lemnae]|uniref:Uncharacterized protein n=1 Tax=Stylonychia lemnae TaxID=5949 RepID=A0A078B102_STYLE|nr:UNKNOWN [Stylonychia lemnae]|eukprot:CDW88310.1 UNKNOWN [Stylonychia lemnae]